MPLAGTTCRAAAPRSIWQEIRAGIVSLKFTLVLLLFSILLVFVATLDQVNLGIWAVQEKYFRSFVVYMPVGPAVVPVFPGGYTIGGLLLVNLIAAHVYRFTFAWRKIGLVLTHFGLIVLLVGELLTGLWQKDAFMTLDEGQTKNYAESFRHNELAVIDVTDAAFDDVVAIPERQLADKTPVQHAKLPFRLRATTYYPNSTLRMRAHTDGPAVATAGVGNEIAAAPLPITYKQNERNVPTAFVELSGTEGPIGTFLVSPHLASPQEFTHAGRTWRIALRAQRTYFSDTFSLLEFSHDRYAGTEIPKNFSSRLKLTAADGGGAREVLIRMNEPLRHAGYTFYQAGFENNDRTTILQVVGNPSWLMPYIACTLVTLGLVVQFGIHLVGFVSKRRGGVAGTVAGRTENVPGSPRRKKRDNVRSADAARAHSLERNEPKSRSWLGRWFPGLIALVTLAAVIGTLRWPGNPGDFDVVSFGRLPVLVNGRIKPMDTVARTSLLMLQGRQRVKIADGRSLTPSEWLLDMLYRPHQADHYQVFEVTHPDVLALLNVAPEDGAGKKRFALRQFAGKLGELDRQAKLGDETEAAVRTTFQRAVVQLRNGVALYQRLQNTLIDAHGAGFLEQLATFESTLNRGGFRQALATPAGDGTALPKHGTPEAKLMLEMARVFATMDAFSYFRPVPPAPGEAPTAWTTMGAAWSGSFGNGRVDPAASAFAAMGRAWRDQQAGAFNASVAGYHRELSNRPVVPLLTKSDAELRFNSAQPFYTSAVLYVVAFLLAVFSWLRWPAALGRAAFTVLVVAFALTTLGIAARMWIEGRPPVTNLYSSALFVGWGAVALCVTLEKVHRNAIVSVAGASIGFATLLIAHHLALGGDTMEMMRAVLDSNFWLATHVVTIAVGYSATFLAGVLAIIYVLRGVFTRSLDTATGAAIGRMIYGIVCFATLFSFVGTILGGIWADQSWGRFWGWDPKENGALLIVLWNSVLLHARWGGLVKTRGLACLAIFGGIVTAWSWFGVNMLGVGLHSYGFMDAAFWWLVAFGLSQMAIIAIAGLPKARWRSAVA